MLVRSLFHVYLIIIALYVVILVWGRYNSFCRPLGERRTRGSRRGLKGCLDKPLFVKVWTILISETCLYILAKLFSSLFQPQYVDGLLNPSHKKLFSTADSYTFRTVQRRGQTELHNFEYGSSNIGVFQWLSVTFMKCCHGNVDMRQNHGKVVTGRDVSFWAITLCWIWGMFSQ